MEILLEKKEFVVGEEICGFIDYEGDGDIVVDLSWETEVFNALLGEKSTFYEPNRKLLPLPKVSGSSRYRFLIKVEEGGPFSYLGEKGKLRYFLRAGVLGERKIFLGAKEEITILPSPKGGTYLLANYEEMEILTAGKKWSRDLGKIFRGCFLILFFVGTAMALLDRGLNKGLWEALQTSFIIGVVLLGWAFLVKTSGRFVYFLGSSFLDTFFQKMQVEVFVEKNVFSPGDVIPFVLRITARKDLFMKEVRATLLFRLNRQDLRAVETSYERADILLKDEVWELAGGLQIPDDPYYHVEIEMGLYSQKSELSIDIKAEQSMKYRVELPIYLIPPLYKHEKGKPLAFSGQDSFVTQ